MTKNETVVLNLVIENCLDYDILITNKKTKKDMRLIGAKKYYTEEVTKYFDLNNYYFHFRGSQRRPPKDYVFAKVFKTTFK